MTVVINQERMRVAGRLVIYVFSMGWEYRDGLDAQFPPSLSELLLKLGRERDPFLAHKSH